MASADGEFDTFLSLTTDDIKRVARMYFTPEAALVMRIMPKGAGPGRVGRCRCRQCSVRSRSSRSGCAVLTALVVAQTAAWPREAPAPAAARSGR